MKPHANTQHDSLQLRTTNPQYPSTKPSPPTTSHNTSKKSHALPITSQLASRCFRGRPRRLFCWPPDTSASPTPARMV
jgi:hypothetical protein